MKYSDIFCGFLKQAGYTHCFCLQGGGIMHLINSAADCFTMVPVVNEIAGAIASEYFNNTESDKKAFLLVTTGPGLTNTITGIAGALFFNAFKNIFLKLQIRGEIYMYTHLLGMIIRMRNILFYIYYMVEEKTKEVGLHKVKPILF